MAIDRNIIKAYAFKNAVEHDGKAVAGSVISGLFNHGLTKGGIKEIMPSVNEILKEVNSLPLEKQEKEFLKYENIIGHRPEREGLPELPNVDKDGVIMRFAPAASGQLHLGHIIAGIPTSLYVKKYGGKLYVRIEDTNPEKTDYNAYEGIKKDCDWLFGNVSEYIIQSGRISIYYKYAEELIKKEASYVCICDNEAFKKLVNAKKSCPCRNISVQENLERWKKMLDKKGYREGEAVLRFKSDLNNPNPALRDFPLARINLKKHPIQGNKYRVWPLMNLSVTVDDIEYEMTHIIRAKEHRDNALRQKMVYKALGKENKFPLTLFIGRIKFTDIALSKRKIKAAIEEGDFEGWEDVRLPTVVVLRKRGYQPKAFEDFAIQRGISEVDKVISQKDLFEVINQFNREILKDKARKAELEKTDEKDANAIILMPDAKKIYGKTDIKVKPDEIVYFKGFGYAKNNQEEKGRNSKSVFWFCHD